MKKGLLFAFSDEDFKDPIEGVSYDLSDIVSLSYVINKSTGAKFARAQLEDGTTLIKPVHSGDAVTEIEYVIPAYRGTAERNSIIKDLAEEPDLTQEMIACMLNISQSTVSNVMRG